MKGWSLILCLIVLSCWTLEPCHSTPAPIFECILGTPWRLLSPHWSDLELQALKCAINAFSDHVLLATSDSTVAHMIGETPTGPGHLNEETWESFHNREGEKQVKCRVDGMLMTSLLRRDRQTSIEMAREDIARFRGQSIHFNLLTCNCEHWLEYWVTGRASSWQSLLPADSDCDVGRGRIRTQSMINTILPGSSLL